MNFAPLKQGHWPQEWRAPALELPISYLHVHNGIMEIIPAILVQWWLTIQEAASSSSFEHSTHRVWNQTHCHTPSPLCTFLCHANYLPLWPLPRHVGHAFLWLKERFSIVALWFPLSFICHTVTAKWVGSKRSVGGF